MSKKTTIHVFGLLTSIKFYKLQYLATKYKKKRRNIEVITDVYFETEWEEFVNYQKRILCGETWSFKDSVMTFVNGLFIGGYDSFISWYETNTQLVAFYPEMFLHDSANEMKERIKSRNHVFVYLYLKSNNIDGTLIFELYTDLLPLTCKNFISLCTGDTRKSNTGIMHYKNSPIHRIVPNGWIQGGDIIKGSGNQGYSIFGTFFPDESFTVSHDRFGVLGMANKGPHTNASQFYITLAPQVWMNGKMVGFGHIISGRSLLKAIEKVQTINERPVPNIVVVDCGVYSIDDVQMIDLTEDDLVLYYSDGIDPPDVPVVINLPQQYVKCAEDVKALRKGNENK